MVKISVDLNHHNNFCIFHCCIRLCEYIHIQLLNQQIYINHTGKYDEAMKPWIRLL